MDANLCILKSWQRTMKRRKAVLSWWRNGNSISSRSRFAVYAAPLRNTCPQPVKEKRALHWGPWRNLCDCHLPGPVRLQEFFEGRRKHEDCPGGTGKVPFHSMVEGARRMWFVRHDTSEEGQISGGCLCSPFRWWQRDCIYSQVVPHGMCCWGLKHRDGNWGKERTNASTCSSAAHWSYGFLLSPAAGVCLQGNSLKE